MEEYFDLLLQHKRICNPVTTNISNTILSEGLIALEFSGSFFTIFFVDISIANSTLAAGDLLSIRIFIL